VSDRCTLFANVLNQPADDTARLVLADWLDEHDEPERAEFIRVQCRMHQLQDAISPARKGRFGSRGAKFAALVAEFRALRPRENELLSTPRDWFDVPGWRTVWNRPLASSDSVTGVATWVPLDGSNLGSIGLEVFPKRGFVGTVSCRWDSWAAFEVPILLAHPVQRVRLSTVPGCWWEERQDGVYCRLDRTERTVSDDAVLKSRKSRGTYRHDRPHSIRDVLEALWDGISFELPPAGTDPVPRERDWRFATSVIGLTGGTPDPFTDPQ
jgi:uncharacterized protein (TIGR02996 family)